MSDDLVKRLRCYADIDDAVYNPWIYGEAADRIKKLEDELHHCFHRINELQAALREIVEQIKQYDLPAPVVTLFVLQKASKALEGKDD
jgi:hypothetical protein